MNTQPYWSLSAKLPQFPALSSDLQVDVVVIGGGLTGITAAHLLKQGGAKVALLERARCAAADTGHTTAHLTYVTGCMSLSKTLDVTAPKLFGKPVSQPWIRSQSWPANRRSIASSNGFPVICTASSPRKTKRIVKHSRRRPRWRRNWGLTLSLPKEFLTRAGQEFASRIRRSFIP